MQASGKTKLIIGLLAALLVVAGVSGWAALDRELFSASGFVKQYLSALARHDAASALSMPGVTAGLEPDAQTALLRSSALGELSDIRIEKTSSSGENTVVTASFVVGTERASANFVVKPAGSTFGIFGAWSFAQRPLSTIAVTVAHDSAFEVGSSGLIDLRSVGTSGATTWGGTQTFLVLSPSNYRFSVHQTMLTAAPVTVSITSPGQSKAVTVDVQATPAFAEQVQKELNEYLDKCVTQHVLQPTGCPFGYQTGNRFVGEPSWAVVEYPAVTVTPGKTGWVVRKAAGKVRITGEIQSLYDGKISPLDKVIDFTTDLDINVRPDGSLMITIV